MTSPSRAGHPVRRAGRRHTDLVVLLTALKDHCGLTFAELAGRTAVLETTTAVSASTLKTVDSRAVPQEHVVTAFVRACGATADQERDALRLRLAARAEDRGVLATLRAPSVTSIRTRADLDAALAAAYERAGAPPLRVLQHRATTNDTDGTVLLPLTSAWRITRRQGRPATWPQCEAFLRGCGIHPRRMRPWHEAWNRAQALAPLPAEHATPPGHRARWWLSRDHLSLPISHACPVCADDLTTPQHPAGPQTPAATRLLVHRTSAETPAATPLLARLTPADRRAVLNARLNHLRGTRARRNGTAPDTSTGTDALAIHDDGTLHLLQYQRLTDTTPPTTSSAPAHNHRLDAS